MKKLLMILILTTLSLSCFAQFLPGNRNFQQRPRLQSDNVNLYLDDVIWPSVALFGAGIAHGVSHALVNYERFESVFPGANPEFWNPEYSMRGYNLSMATGGAFIITGITIKLGDNRKTWLQYTVEALVMTGAYTAGYSTTRIIFR